MDRLKGKVAIITGAAGGSCYKTCELFCQEGAKVIMTDLDPSVEELSKGLNEKGGDTVALVGDIAQKDTWVALKKLGLEKLS